MKQLTSAFSRAIRSCCKKQSHHVRERWPCTAPGCSSADAMLMHIVSASRPMVAARGHESTYLSLLTLDSLFLQHVVTTNREGEGNQYILIVAALLVHLIPDRHYSSCLQTKKRSILLLRPDSPQPSRVQFALAAMQ